MSHLNYLMSIIAPYNEFYHNHMLHKSNGYMHYFYTLSNFFFNFFFFKKKGQNHILFMVLKQWKYKSNGKDERGDYILSLTSKNIFCGGLAMIFCLPEAIFTREKLWKMHYAPSVDVNRKQRTLHILWTCISAMDAWSVGPRRLQKKLAFCGFWEFYSVGGRCVCWLWAGGNQAFRWCC